MVSDPSRSVSAAVSANAYISSYDVTDLHLSLAGVAANSEAFTIITAGRSAGVSWNSGPMSDGMATISNAAMPILHLRGRGVGGPIAASTLGVFFIWVPLAIGTTGSVAAILSARGLWRLRPRRPGATNAR